MTRTTAREPRRAPDPARGASRPVQARSDRYSGPESASPGGRTLRLVGYLRVSSVEQERHGYGLDTQRAAIKATARALGARVVKWATDAGVSGALPADERPGLTEALSLVRTGKADGLIVRDMDRLARSVTVQEAVLGQLWNRLDGRMFTAVGEVERDDPDDPYRTAMREMAGVFAGLERRMVVKRLRDGRAEKKRQGGHSVGRAPYGWTTSPRVPGSKGAPRPLVRVPAEQKALRRMRELQAEGASTRAIAETLTDEDHPTKHGAAKWSSATVARILARDTTPSTDRKASA